MSLDEANTHRFFFSILEWLMAIAFRYGDPVQFGLVHISYAERDPSPRSLLTPDEDGQFDSVMRTIKNTFRKTDLACRVGQDFWVIVPYTPATEKLYEKVLEILEAAELDGLDIYHREIQIFNVTENKSELQPLLANPDAQELLRYLKENKTGLASHIFSLPSNRHLSSS